MAFSGTDETLTCADCAQPFPFTAKEQEFYASKGFTARPRRCKGCRTLKKVAQASREQESASEAQGGGDDDRGNRRRR